MSEAEHTHLQHKMRVHSWFAEQSCGFQIINSIAPVEYHATFSNSPNHGLQVGNNAGNIETHNYNYYPVGKLSLLHRNKAVCANLPVA
jgi:hypothetical protein